MRARSINATSTGVGVMSAQIAPLDDASCGYNNVINHPPVITIDIVGMFTIPRKMGGL